MTTRLRDCPGLITLLVLLIPLAACGGGSGGEDTSVPLPPAVPMFAGEYSYGQFGLQDSPNTDPFSEWGLVTRDTTTNVLGGVAFVNRNGIESSGNRQYDSLEGTDGAFSMWSGSPTRPYEGYLTADRRMGAFAASHNGAGPALGVLMRRAADASQVQFVEHHLLRSWFVTSTGEFSVLRALAPVGVVGQAAVPFPGVKNTDGTISTPSLAGHFGVFSDGSVTGATDLRFRDGGDMAFGAGRSDISLVLEFLIRPSVGFQASTAAGTYHVFWIERSALGFSLGRGTLTLRADRTGTFERQFINVGGLIITTPSTIALTMAESSDGSVELTFPSTRYGGAFTPSADMGVLVGGLDDGDGPGMMVLVRAE